MIGKKYWATGIIVKYIDDARNGPSWGADVTFLDDGFCDDDPVTGRVSTEGTLRTRYLVAGAASEVCLTAAVTAVKNDADRLGVEWRDPAVWYYQDGETEEYPPPPGWQRLISAQAAVLGWRFTYSHIPADDALLPAEAPSTCTCGCNC